MSPAPRPVELVVLLDEGGRAVGTADKRTVHHRETPLHLAFSCYVVDDRHRVLVTRRALHKPTWPGVWTNSVCGHPAPEEDMTDAIRRRASDELGIGLLDVRLALPSFRYRAVMPDGVVENEMCPVFVARSADVVRPSADEVDDYEWVDWHTFRTSVLDGTRTVSPWCVDQVRALPPDAFDRGPVPPDGLPPAARIDTPA
ncbi:MAG: isopentenyl-diphosphate Delta-isomerase [Nocardioidaceae bacterium]